MNHILENIFHTHFNNMINTVDETNERATDIGIELTDEHWDVIEFVSNIYMESGIKGPKQRELRALLKNNFKHKGGYQYLYQLFPKEPVETLSYLVRCPVSENEYRVSCTS